MPLDASPAPTDQPDSRSLTRRYLLGAGVLGIAGAAVACGGSSTPHPTTTPSRTPSPTASATPPPNPKAIKANELGFVPVLMHHRLVDHVNSEFDMTPAYFRAELERLHTEGYYPVSTLDLVRRNFAHVPAGKTPVVLTFDDGSAEQFALSSDGRVDPRTAVGMMLAYANENPDFPAVASMYVNKEPFATTDTRAVLGTLHQLGFEIGNHTWDHVDLSSLSTVKVEAEFAKITAMVSRAVPGLRPLTMALPFGISPKSKSAERTGTSNGTTYVNEAALLVGANPSHSPYNKEFRPLALPRIRSSSYHPKAAYLTTYWLDYLKAHDDVRYRVAGNPAKVTFPRSFAGSLAPRFRARAVMY